MSLKKRIIEHHKEGILLNYLYQRLKKTNLTLYYLVEERLLDNRGIGVKAKLDPLEVVELGQSDMAELAARSERDFSENQMLKMLSNECGCLALR